MIFFKKISLQNFITGADGKAIVFTPTNDGDGAISVEENTPAAADLQKYADTRSGGVVQISGEIYEELLKKKASIPSRNQSSQNGIRTAKRPVNPFGSQPATSAEVAASPATPEVRDDLPPNRNQFMRKTRRLNASEPNNSSENNSGANLAILAAVINGANI